MPAAFGMLRWLSGYLGLGGRYAKPKISHGPPYEIHFYPGLLETCIIGTERL